MDGLECSEIRMSDVCDTTTLRFDSDYYKKEYLEIEQFICKNRDKFVTIESPLLKSYPYCIQQLCIIFILYAVSILRFIFVVKWYKRRFSIASKERR